MKIKHLLVLTIVVSSLLIFAASSFASSKSPASPQDFETSKGWAKTDLRFREAWRSSKGAERFECILKASRVISDDDKAVLKTAGFMPRTYIGAIVTGSVAARNLPAVANLDFVEVMELASPLTPKKKD